MPAVQHHQFPQTQWTAIAQLCQADDPEIRRVALIGICRDYWYPLYAYARRQGHDVSDAEDLTQGFFAYVVERNPFTAANREMGRLRTFMLIVFQRYIADTLERQRAQKRGGRHQFVSFDSLKAEELYAHEPLDPLTPEIIFERTWALQVLRNALETLRITEQEQGRGRIFEILRPFLDPEPVGEPCLNSTMVELGLSADAVRQVISRLRRKFRDHLRQHIAATLRNPGEANIDEELFALQAALRH